MFKYTKTVIHVLLLVSLIVVPGRVLMAITLMNIPSIDAVANIKKNASSLKEGKHKNIKLVCEHCKKNNCHDNHQCNNCQCFTSIAVLSSYNADSDLYLSESKISSYTVGLVISSLSSLYRPPK